MMIMIVSVKCHQVLGSVFRWSHSTPLLMATGAQLMAGMKVSTKGWG